MSAELGIYLNNRAAVFLDDYSAQDLLRAANLAEEAGFDLVSVGDSTLAKPRYAPIPLLSAIGSITSQLKLATGILQPHMRNPVLLAQEWTTLDVISEGKSILAVGLGTGPRELVEHEYKLLGIPKSKRGVAFEEAIQILKKLWTEAEETIDFRGEIYELSDVSLGYKPIQTPHPPIVIACGGYIPSRPGVGPNDFFKEEAAGTFQGPFERVSRLGDGWITGTATPEEFSRTLQYIRTVASEQYGRNLGSEFRATVNCFINVNDDTATAKSEATSVLEAYHRLPLDEETFERWVIYGSAEQCAERLGRFVNAGANSFQLVIAARDQLGQIETIAEEVSPLLDRYTNIST